MQDLQPHGVFEPGEGVETYHVAEKINKDGSNAMMVMVPYGDDYIVTVEDGGGWVYLGEFTEERGDIYATLDEVSDKNTDYFIVDVPGESGRYLFTQRED